MHFRSGAKDFPRAWKKLADTHACVRDRKKEIEIKKKGAKRLRIVFLVGL